MRLSAVGAGELRCAESLLATRALIERHLSCEIQFGPDFVRLFVRLRSNSDTHLKRPGSNILSRNVAWLTEAQCAYDSGF